MVLRNGKIWPGREVGESTRAAHQPDAQANTHTNTMEGGPYHRQSVVSASNMAHADNALHLLFKTFADDEDELGPGPFLQLVEEAGILGDSCGRALASASATLAFQRAKVGRKKGLTFDRFKESVGMMSVEKGIVYQQLVPFAVNTFRSARAAAQRIELAAATRFTVTLGRGEDRGLGVVLFIEEEIPNRLRVDEVNEDSAAGRYNAAVIAENAEADAADAGESGAAAGAAAATTEARKAAADGSESDTAEDVAAAEAGGGDETDDDGEEGEEAQGEAKGKRTRRLAIELGDYVVEVLEKSALLPTVDPTPFSNTLHQPTFCRVSLPMRR